MNVGGIDPSLTGTGVIVLDSKMGLVLSELIKSKKTGGTIAEVERIRTIADKAVKLVEGCDLVLIEGLAFMARNTTALVQLSALNYFLRYRLIDKNIPFRIVAPSSLKKFITGKGNAKKDSMYLEIYKRYGFSFSDDNLADAFGLAAIGRATLIDEELPQFQQEVVELISKQV